MWKFEANRCGFCDMLKIDLSELCHPDSVIALVLKSQHRFFCKQIYILLYWISAKYTNAKLISRFEVNRCGCHGGMHNISELCCFDLTVSLSFFKLTPDLFQEIILLYLILTRASNAQLMCKFEANQCGFHDAIDLSDNVMAILKSMQKSKIVANENMQVVSDWLYFPSNILLFCILSNMAAALSERSMAENRPFETLSF